MPKSRTRNPLFSHPTNIWDLLRAKHCSRPLDTLVNKKAKRHRPKHHNSKELMKEKKKNPDQAQEDNEGRKISHCYPFDNLLPLVNCYL